MKRFVAGVALALTALFGVSAAAPASAAVPAGNYTKSFYLTGGCNPNGGAPLLGVNMKFTNYTSNSGQIYHVSWSRSGVAYSVTGVYIDGVKYGTSRDQYIYVPGHGPHFVGISDTFLGKTYRCNVWK